MNAYFGAGSPLENIVLGTVAGIAADRAQAPAHAALRLRSINPFDRQFHQKRNERERADGDENDRGRLSRGPVEALSHEQAEAEADRALGHGEQSVQRQCFRRFWDG